MKIPIGAFTVKSLIHTVSHTGKIINGKTIPCRPIPYKSTPTRLRMALDVFSARADALYWDDSEYLKPPVTPTVQGKKHEGESKRKNLG